MVCVWIKTETPFHSTIVRVITGHLAPTLAQRLALTSSEFAVLCPAPPDFALCVSDPSYRSVKVGLVGGLWQAEMLTEQSLLPSGDAVSAHG